MLCNRVIAYRNILLSYIGKLIPVKKYSFFFCSFHGQYTDSPKKISEMLHNKYPEAEFVWEISDKCHEIIPNYVIKVKPNTLKAIWKRNRSKFVIDNYFGWSYGYAAKHSFKFKILAGQKKKKQFGICTWHGTPLKHIQIDEPKYKNKNVEFYSTADVLTCNSVFMRDLYNRINECSIPVVMKGTPRNDIFFEKNETKKEQILKKLELPVNKKIIIYAPTFRENDIQMSGIKQIKDIDIQKLLKILHVRFGGEWLFVFRAHDSVVQCVEGKFKNEMNNVISGNIGDDMAEYLAVADVLLTDYSSCLFDFTYTQKPCFLYCPDIEKYEKMERGLYFQMDELPYTYATCVSKLYTDILNYDFEITLNKIERFLKKIGSVESGISTKCIVELIESKINIK